MFPTELADSIAAPAAEIAQLKDLTFDELVSTLTSRLIHFSISLAVAILVFYAGRFIITRLYTFVEKVMLKRHVEPSLTTFILSLIRIVLYFILLVTVIGILGIETSSFIAIFASAGVAIGMALSGTLQNFAGGVLILLLKPFKVGDTIEAQGFAGTVKKIEIFNTIITTPDNKTIIIPNGGLSTAPINNSTTQDYRRIEWKVGISYGDSTERFRQAVQQMLDSDPDITEAVEKGGMPAPVSVVASLDDSAVTMSVRAWVKKERYWDVFFNYNERFYNELPERAGISFPFPQMDVHLDK